MKCNIHTEKCIKRVQFNKLYNTHSIYMTPLCSRNRKLQLPWNPLWALLSAQEIITILAFVGNHFRALFFFSFTTFECISSLFNLLPFIFIPSYWFQNSHNKVIHEQLLNLADVSQFLAQQASLLYLTLPIGSSVLKLRSMTIFSVPLHPLTSPSLSLSKAPLPALYVLLHPGVHL